MAMDKFVLNPNAITISMRTNTFTTQNQIRAIWIDVDQTLLDFDLCAKSALIDVFAWKNLEWKEEYYSIFLVENAKLWDQIEEGKITRDQLRKIRFEIMFEKWHIPYKPDVEFEAYFSKHLHSYAYPMPNALQVLQILVQQNYPLYIVSNGPAKGQRNRLQKAGMLDLFQDVFTSEELGHAKPNLLFFEQALEKVRCEQHDPTICPEQILIIGDSWKADISGSLAFGSHSIWFRRNREFDPFDQPNEPSVLEAYNWNEVLEIISSTFTSPISQSNQ